MFLLQYLWWEWHQQQRRWQGQQRADERVRQTAEDNQDFGGDPTQQQQQWDPQQQSPTESVWKEKADHQETNPRESPGLPLSWRLQLKLSNIIQSQQAQYQVFALYCQLQIMFVQVSMFEMSERNIFRIWWILTLLFWVFEWDNLIMYFTSCAS